MTWRKATTEDYNKIANKQREVMEKRKSQLIGEKKITSNVEKEEEEKFEFIIAGDKYTGIKTDVGKFKLGDKIRHKMGGAVCEVMGVAQKNKEMAVVVDLITRSYYFITISGLDNSYIKAT